MINKVLIDYFGGSHGHFLEFTLNGLEDDRLLSSYPFNEDGTCRNRIYDPYSKRFHADHFSTGYYKKFIDRSADAEDDGDCIAITFADDYSDWLLYLEVAFLRGRRAGLEIGHIDDIVNNTKDKFKTYPVILNLLGDNPTKSSIRRFILEYLVRNPENSLYHRVHQVPFLTHKRIHNFKFSWFYNYTNFITGLTELTKTFNLTLHGKERRIQELHTEFLRLNKFANRRSKEICDNILEYLQGDDISLSLNLIEEAYICKRIEELTGNKLTEVDDSVFTSTGNLKKFINEISIRH